jgi:hypothetical protein
MATGQPVVEQFDDTERMVRGALLRRRLREGATARELAAARRELQRVRADLAELDALKARVTELEEQLAALERVNGMLADTLLTIRDHVLRAEASTAWRMGHFVTTLGRRVTFRKVRGHGALRAAAGRIERAERAARALPAGPSMPDERALPAGPSTPDERTLRPEPAMPEEPASPS